MRLLTRVLYGIAGLLAIVFGLMQIFGSGIPNCDASDVQDTLRDVTLSLGRSDVVGTADDNAKEKLKDAMQVTNVAEQSWDKDKKSRVCTATVSLTAGDKMVFENMRIQYTIAPSPSDSKTIEVRVHQLGSGS